MLRGNDNTRMSPDEFRSVMRKHLQVTRELILTPGDPGPLCITKLSGLPWWPAGTARPVCERGHAMPFVAQIRLSDVPILAQGEDCLLSFHYCEQCVSEGNMAWGWNDKANKGYDISIFFDLDTKKPDREGLLHDPILDAYEVSFREVLEVPHDYQEVGLRFADRPGDYPQKTGDFDEHIYPGLVHVAKSKVGGWPTWVQGPEWPEAQLGETIRFVCQLDWGVCDRAPWCVGGYAYLFVREREGKALEGQLVIQVT